MGKLTAEFSAAFSRDLKKKARRRPETARMKELARVDGGC